MSTTGVLCGKRVRQMVHLCPDLFIIRPGFDKSDETLVTLELVTPPPLHTRVRSYKDRYKDTYKDTY